VLILGLYRFFDRKLKIVYPFLTDGMQGKLAYFSSLYQILVRPTLVINAIMCCLLTFNHKYHPAYTMKLVRGSTSPRRGFLLLIYGAVWCILSGKGGCSKGGHVLSPLIPLPNTTLRIGLSVIKDTGNWLTSSSFNIAVQKTMQSLILVAALMLLV